VSKETPKTTQQQYIPTAESQLPRDGRTERTASSNSTRRKNKNELTDQSPTTQDESVLATLPPSGYDQSPSDDLMWKGN